MNKQFTLHTFLAGAALMAITPSSHAVLCNVPPPGPQGNILVGDNEANTATPTSGSIGLTSPFNDAVRGRDGRDILVGGAGDDCLDGGEDDDLLAGSDGNDFLFGGNGNNFILGQGGNDLIVAGNGNDTISGGDGDDVIFGGGGIDTIIQGSGDSNQLNANTSTHTRIFGDEGNDRIEVTMGSGSQLYGGLGNDTYVLNQAEQFSELSTRRTVMITDFEGENTLQLEALHFNTVAIENREGVLSIIDTKSKKALIQIIGNGIVEYQFADTQLNAQEMLQLVQ